MPARTRTAAGAAAALVLALALAGCGPIGPIPGGALSGEAATGPVGDWSFLDQVDTVQLETDPADPHSVNTWIGAYQGRPYIPTSLIRGTENPAERDWVQNVLADDRVVVRIDGKLYPRRAVRVEDETEREAARTALLAKYEVEPDEHARGAWIFRLDPR